MTPGLLRWLIPLSAVPVLALLAYGFRVNPRDIPSPLVGRPASAFALQTLEGAPLALEAQRGKVVVLNFWASWCVDCKLEAKTLHAAAAKWGKDVVFVGVDTKDFASAARSYMRRYDVNYHVVRDVDGSTGDRTASTACRRRSSSTAGVGSAPSTWVPSPTRPFA